MEEEKKHICSICDEEVDNNLDVYITLDGQAACEDCHERAIDSASQAIQFTPDGPEKYIFTAEFGRVDIDMMPDPIKAERWVNTDGWRGYTTWDLNPGYTELADGWVTGYPDETTERKADLSDYFDRLESGELLPPCEIWWIFGRTSNIFSSASAIICKTDDVEKIKSWLLEIDGGLEHFKEMLA